MASSNLAENITAIKQKDRTLQTWTGGSNTFTVTDNHVKTNSQFIFHNVSTFAGRWFVTGIVEQTSTAQGSFVINSTNAEITNPTFYYTIL